MPSALVSLKLRHVFIAFLTLVTLVLTFTLVTGGASAAEPVSLLISPSDTPTVTATGTPMVTSTQGTFTTTPAPTESSTLTSTDTPVTTNTSSPVSTQTPVPPTATPTECVRGWNVVSSPNQSGGDQLRSVAVVSASDIWAVGYYESSSGEARTLVLHWDGTTWGVTTSPNVGVYANNLYSVVAVSANDVWAVGAYYNNSHHDVGQTLILHWDGSIWSVVPSPNMDTYSNFLLGVAVVSASDIWAVGSYRDIDPFVTGQTLILHWDGSIWSAVPSPNVGTLDNGLNAVAAVSANDVWAVGPVNYNTNHKVTQTLILHWDGSTWSVVPSPNLSTYTNNLYSVAAVSASDIWAVGSYLDPSPYAVNRPLILHWDGSIWSAVPNPDFGTVDIRLYAVAAVSANDVWAVGGHQGGYVGGTLIEHWNGSIWSVVPSPNVGGSDVLLGVAAVSANDVWAVGSYPMGSGDQTLAARYNSCQATICTISFEDVPVGSTFYPYIQCLACRGIMSGYPCGGAGEPCNGNNDPYFRPGNNVTRGQFAKIASNAAGFVDPSYGQQYEDVLPGSTFYDNIWRLSNRGYINGYPCGGPGEPCGPNNLPYFRPNANITRGQIAKIDANTAGFNDSPGTQQYEDVLPGSTFYDYIWRLSSRGLVNGYPCGGVGEPCGSSNLSYFRPSANAMRGQASKIVSNTFFPDCAP